MQLKHETFYEGWQIATLCQPRFVDDSGVQKIAARVGFQLADPSVFKAGWKKNEPRSIPEKGYLIFDCANSAHQSLIQQAKTTIDSLKTELGM